MGKGKGGSNSGKGPRTPTKGGGKGSNPKGGKGSKGKGGPEANICRWCRDLHGRAMRIHNLSQEEAYRAFN